MTPEPEDQELAVLAGIEGEVRIRPEARILILGILAYDKNNGC
jgi:hypothetical protein